MTTGRLDRIIEIQRRVVTRDSFGGEVETWEEVDTVWARVNQTGIDERFENEANRERATRDARMTILFRDGIDETMRVIYDEQAWDIRGIAELGFKNKLELTVQADIGGVLYPFTGFTVMGGLSVDNIPEASEITIAQSAHNLVFPAYTDRHVLIWRLATEPDIVAVVLASDPTQANQIGGWSKYVDSNDDPILIEVGGQDGNVWVSDHLLTHSAETLELA